MKYLYALVGIVLITSCATTQIQLPAPYSMTTEQRFAKCTAQNLNKYIGDCVMQTFDVEQGHAGWMQLYGTQDDWKLVVDTNNDISRRYKLGQLNAETSNLLFERVYNLTRDIVNTRAKEMQTQAEADRAKAEADRIRLAQVLKDLEEGLGKANAALNQGNPNYANNEITRKKRLTRSTYLNNGKTECKYGIGVNEIIIIKFGTCESYIQE